MTYLHVQDGKGPTSGLDDFNQVSRITIKFGNKGNRVKVTVEQTGLPTPKRSVILSYDGSNVIQLRPVMSIESHPSIRSTAISRHSVF
ncbi:MAG TPA: hypothetical protein VE130_15260 [Nitrososphaeraceae archaeon]|nr:hypothetical protein [Nitrososphaeraceae archaeon]